jgi:hypothetical protein
MLQIILMFTTSKRLNDFTFPQAGHAKANRNVKNTQSLPLLNMQQQQKLNPNPSIPHFCTAKPT